MSSLHRELSWQQEDQAARLGCVDAANLDTFVFSPGWTSQRVCLPPTERFVALDFETTGFAPGRDMIIEIGAIRVLPGTSKSAKFQRLIAIPSPVPHVVRQLTGIDDDLLRREGVDLCDALADLLDFLGDDPVVAYNAPFDLAFLNAACEEDQRHGIDAHHSCALALTRRAWPRLPSYKLSYVAARLGVEADGAHRALGDAYRAAVVYRAAVIECLGVHHLASEASQRMLSAMRRDVGQ